MKTPQVVIDIKGRDVQMSAEEARRVFDQLAKFFQVAPVVILKEATVEHHYHERPPIVVPSVPMWPPYEITCGSNSSLS